LLIIKNILSATGQLIIKNILKDNAQISATGQLIIKNILNQQKYLTHLLNATTIISADGSTQSTSSTGSLMISADTLDNSGYISANEITLNIGKRLSNKDNAQISADGQLIIKNIPTSADSQSISEQDDSATSNHLVVNNEGLLHSKDVVF
jgi:adhesin HecA-like repeat protein